MHSSQPQLTTIRSKVRKNGKASKNRSPLNIELKESHDQRFVNSKSTPKYNSVVWSISPRAKAANMKTLRHNNQKFTYNCDQSILETRNGKILKLKLTKSPKIKKHGKGNMRKHKHTRSQPEFLPADSSRNKHLAKEPSLSSISQISHVDGENANISRNKANESQDDYVLALGSLTHRGKSYWELGLSSESLLFLNKVVDIYRLHEE